MTLALSTAPACLSGSELRSDPRGSGQGGSTSLAGGAGGTASTGAGSTGGTTSTSTGTPSSAGEAFGATVGPGGVTFRVWAPHAVSAWVTGDFPEQKVAMEPIAGGVFEVTLASAHAGTKYQFAFDTGAGSIDRSDPYCRELAADSHSCTVMDPSGYAWKNASFKAASRQDSIVYELHVGSFAVESGAPQGTFASARSKLADLASLGVNVVELMPVQAFGGKPNGWGYNPQLYFAPKPSYGSADELRALVDEAHGLEMGVWLDTVLNHTDGSNKAPLYCFDGTCPDGSAGVYFFPPGQYAKTPWGPRPDYTEPRVKGMLLDAAAAWLTDYHGDGFRVDSTSNIRGIDGQGTTPGGHALLGEMNALAHSHGALSVAEDLKGFDGITKPSAQGGFGFDAQWDGFGYDIMAQLAEPSDDKRNLDIFEKALRGTYAGDPFARLLFIEDHDTVGNGGTRLPDRIDKLDPTSYWARKRAMLGGVLLLTAPGVPHALHGARGAGHWHVRQPAFACRRAGQSHPPGPEDARFLQGHDPAAPEPGRQIRRPVRQ